MKSTAKESFLNIDELNLSKLTISSIEENSKTNCF